MLLHSMAWFGIGLLVRFGFKLIERRLGVETLKLLAYSDSFDISYPQGIIMCTFLQTSRPPQLGFDIVDVDIFHRVLDSKSELKQSFGFVRYKLVVSF